MGREGEVEGKRKKKWWWERKREPKAKAEKATRRDNRVVVSVGVGREEGIEAKQGHEIGG